MKDIFMNHNWKFYSYLRKHREKNTQKTKTKQTKKPPKTKKKPQNPKKSSK